MNGTPLLGAVLYASLCTTTLYVYYILYCFYSEMVIKTCLNTYTTSQ